MRPPGFFDLEDRFAKLDGLGDPLVKIAQVVDWEGFHSVLNRAFAKARKSNAGRKEYGRVLMFKILVLQQLYNLSDDQTEFQIRDRYSFGRFLGLNPEAVVPDAKTIWRFREGLKSGEVFDSLFSQLSSQIAEQGYVARKGQIVDASIVKAPRQRNTREDNAQEKGGEIPEDWSENKRRHKDVDARWTRKHGVTHYGYKNHISMDREFGLVRRWEVTDGACHDSRVFEQVLDETNTNGDVWADSAYCSREHERLLAEGGWRSHIHRKAHRNRPLSARSRQANRKRSKVRAAVEHVFAQHEAMGGKRVRTIGLARARIKVGMMNLVYNLRRLAWLKSNRRPIYRYAVN
jgi:IS5 family transposase